MLFDDSACSESEFQRVGTATEKARVPVWVFTLGTDNKWKPDKRISLGLGARENMEIGMKVLWKKEFDRP